MKIYSSFSACALALVLACQEGYAGRAGEAGSAPDPAVCDSGAPGGQAWRFVADGDVLCIDGRLDDADFADFPTTARFSWVVVRSMGGEAPPALTVARAMIRNNADVLVRGECLSACANYVFLAGRRKVVLPGAYLGWHGAIPSTRYQAIMQSSDPGARALYARHSEELAETGQTQISDAEWNDLGETFHQALARQQQWLPAQAEVLEHRGVMPHFFTAFVGFETAMPAHVWNTYRSWDGRIGVFWSPSFEQLRQWGVTGLEGWEPESEAERFMFGLAQDDPVLLTQTPLALEPPRVN